MNPPTSLPHQIRTGNSQVGAFTLIELLAVMAIILILAGLILGIAGHAQYESALKRAESEIKGLETAIESYKVDNGAYPRNASTDALNAYQDFDPASGQKYQLASECLYQQLSGNIPAGTGTTVTTTKPYFDFKPNQLGVANDAAGGITTPTTTSPYMYVQDPFGFSYGYSTIYQKALETIASATDPSATPAPNQGYNPTFDLWSTAGYSATAGKSTPSRTAPGTTPATFSSLWVKNW